MYVLFRLIVSLPKRCSKLWTSLANQRNKYLKQFSKYLLFTIFKRLELFNQIIWTFIFKMLYMLKAFSYAACTYNKKAIFSLIIIIMLFFSSKFFLVLWHFFIVGWHFAFSGWIFLCQSIWTSQREPCVSYCLVLLLFSFIFLKLCIEEFYS